VNCRILCRMTCVNGWWRSSRLGIPAMRPPRTLLHLCLCSEPNEVLVRGWLARIRTRAWHPTWQASAPPRLHLRYCRAPLDRLTETGSGNAVKWRAERNLTSSQYPRSGFWRTSTKAVGEIATHKNRKPVRSLNPNRNWRFSDQWHTCTNRRHRMVADRHAPCFIPARRVLKLLKERRIWSWPD